MPTEYQDLVEGLIARIEEAIRQLDPEVIPEGVPRMTLLATEERLASARNTYDAVPNVAQKQRLAALICRLEELRVFHWPEENSS